MKLLRLLCLPVCFAAAAAAAAAMPPPSIDLNGQIDYLEDPSGRLTFDDVRQPAQAARFVPLAGTNPNFGFTHSSYWLRLKLVRPAGAPADWVLQVGVHHLAELSLFTPGQPELQAGIRDPYQPAEPSHPLPVFALNLAAGEQYVYLRARCHHGLSLPLSLETMPSFLARTQKMMLVQSLYFGGLLTLMGYSLLLWLLLKDRRLLLYTLFSATFGMAMFAGNGYGRMFLWPTWPGFDSLAAEIMLAVAAGLCLQFTRQFLPPHLLRKGLDRSLQLTAMLLFGLSVLLLASTEAPERGYELVMALEILSIGAAIQCISVSVFAQFYLSRPGRLFMLAVTVLWIGAMIATARMHQLLPTNLLTVYALQISSVFEMVLMLTALAAMFQDERQQRDTAHQAKIEAKQQMIRALRASSSKLEREILARTEPLRAALTNEKQISDQYVRFSALISHEVRNPLGIIQGQLSLIRKEQQLGTLNLNNRLNILGSAVNRLLALFEQWVETGRINKYLQDPIYQQIELRGFMRKLLNASLHLVVDHRLDVQLGDCDCQITVDVSLLEIAVNNLLSNASKYSPPGSLITVTLRCGVSRIGISVTDQGKGISPEHRDAIFDEYFRADPDADVPGVGLGLSNVRRIVALHGGELEIRSVPEQGSSFCIWLPVQPFPSSPCVQLLTPQQ